MDINIDINTDSNMNRRKGKARQGLDALLLVTNKIIQISLKTSAVSRRN